MARDSFQLHFIGVTLFLVGLLGAITWATLRPPKQVVETTSQADRTPASQINIRESQTLNKVTSLTETLDLKCVTNGQLQELQTQARQLRLVGRLCPPKQAKKGKVLAPEIINQTNGFLATVFVPQSNLFTSDYIYLAQGKNQVLLTWESENGQKIHSEFVIVRQ